jgi:single-stranded DNA-binding protein
MSLHVLALGTLVADPQQRTSSGGKVYVTANLRTPTDEDAVLVSVVAFSDSAKAALLALGKGDSVSVTGRAKLTAWTGKEGEQRQGLSVVADAVLSAYAVGKKRDATAVARSTRADQEVHA